MEEEERQNTHVPVYCYGWKGDEEADKLQDCERHVDVVEFTSQKSCSRKQASASTHFFQYKMNPEHDIATHISVLEALASQLNALGEVTSDSAVRTKIVCTLKSEYKNALLAWDNVPQAEQTIEKLQSRLLKEELLNSKREDADEGSSQALCSHSKKSEKSNCNNTQKKQSRKDSIKELKSRTKCHNCREIGHWAKDCEIPKKRGHNSKKKSEVGSRSHVNTVCSESMAFTISESPNNQDLWYADGGASEHMIDKREWFMTWKPVERGFWPIYVASKRKLWIAAKGDIAIKRLV